MLDRVFHFKYKGQDIYLNGWYGVHHDYITVNHRLPKC